jgi:hypothetical protein
MITIALYVKDANPSSLSNPLAEGFVLEYFGIASSSVSSSSTWSIGDKM